MPKAFITGITGQDGSYLTEHLISLGYEVYGMVRRSSSFNTSRLEHLRDSLEKVSSGFSKYYGTNLYLAYGDLTDGGILSKLIHEIRPDEIYNLGAQSHVRVSFDQPEYTVETNALGNLRLLEVVRGIDKPIKYYQASSSEMFGNAPAPQNESTPLNPCSPYGIAKVCAFHQVVHYRDSYNLFACNGILFNHESPRRGETFVTRKITRAATRIKLGLQQNIVLGNLEAKRDWGFAPDYVEAMHLIMQQDKPDDYVIATGETHSVKEFLEAVFAYLNLDPYKYLQTNEIYFRPTELNILFGDSSKAKKELEWKPRYSFSDIVKIMVDADLKIAKREKIINGG